MGFFMSKLWRTFFGSQEYKILLVGLDNAGKTTILYQLMLHETVETSPTLGSNVEEVKWGGLRLLIWYELLFISILVI